MKKPIAMTLVSLALLTATRAHAADDLQLAPTSPMSDAQARASAHRRAVAMEVSGIVLTAAGIVGTTVGAIQLVASLDSNEQHYVKTGLPTVIVSQAAAVAGITLWAVGGMRAHKTAPRVSLSMSGIGGTF